MYNTIKERISKERSEWTVHKGFHNILIILELSYYDEFSIRGRINVATKRTEHPSEKPASGDT